MQNVTVDYIDSLDMDKARAINTYLNMHYCDNEDYQFRKFKDVVMMEYMDLDDHEFNQHVSESCFDYKELLKQKIDFINRLNICELIYAIACADHNYEEVFDVIDSMKSQMYIGDKDIRDKILIVKDRFRTFPHVRLYPRFMQTIDVNKYNEECDAYWDMGEDK